MYLTRHNITQEHCFNCETDSTYTGAAGLVLHRNEKFTTVKLKPSL